LLYVLFFGKDYYNYGVCGVCVCIFVYEIKRAKGGGCFRSKSLVLFIELQCNFVWKESYSDEL